VSEENSTARRTPSKPYPDYPLYPHSSGRWAKKIRSKIHYFGPWENHAGTLNRSPHKGKWLSPLS